MSAWLFFLALVLTTSLLAGLVRAARGPTFVDRMLAAQLMGTTVVCVLLLISRAMDYPGLVDISLIFGLLAAVAAVASTKFGANLGKDSAE